RQRQIPNRWELFAQFMGRQVVPGRLPAPVELFFEPIRPFAVVGMLARLSQKGTDGEGIVAFEGADIVSDDFEGAPSIGLFRAGGLVALFHGGIFRLRAWAHNGPIARIWAVRDLLSIAPLRGHWLRARVIAWPRNRQILCS